MRLTSTYLLARQIDDPVLESDNEGQSKLSNPIIERKGFK